MPPLEVTIERRADRKRILKLDWTWIAMVCLLLGISGGLRSLRDRQFFSLVKESERPPFPLAEFPERLGSWYAIEGSERRLEPEIARIAGASDHLERIYRDEKTGQTADVLILYGLAEVVWPHSPGICYPAQGFASVSPSRDQDVLVSVPDSATKARFLEQHFYKSSAGHVDYRVVYHSYLNAAHWDYDVGKNWKSFRYHPGMLRVQVQRHAENSDRTEESFQELLGRIVQEIERHSPITR